MILAHRPPRGQKPGYVWLTFKSWDAFEYIHVLNADGPVLSLSSVQIRLDCNRSGQFKSEQQDDGRVVVVMEVPGKETRLRIRIFSGEHKPEVVWVNRVYAGINKIMDRN